MLDLLTHSLLDPFRAGLIVALFLTALRTRHQTGMAVPLGVGIVFVAAIIPITRGTTPILIPIAMGIAANIVLMGIVLAMWAIVARR
jgi:hypothetical protein